MSVLLLFYRVIQYNIHGTSSMQHCELNSTLYRSPIIYIVLDHLHIYWLAACPHACTLLSRTKYLSHYWAKLGYIYEVNMAAHFIQGQHYSFAPPYIRALWFIVEWIHTLIKLFTCMDCIDTLETTTNMARAL